MVEWENRYSYIRYPLFVIRYSLFGNHCLCSGGVRPLIDVIPSLVIARPGIMAGATDY